MVEPVHDESVDDESVTLAPAILHTTTRTPVGEVGVHVWPAVDPSGRPVLVALHGWTDGGRVFAPLADALARRWTVIGIDAPAHGLTRWPAQGASAAGYRVAVAAEQAAAVIEALPRPAGRRAPVVLLGHSMGGVTAARVAAALPGVVVHAVLEDPARTTARAVRNPSRWRRGVALLQAMTPDERESLSRKQNPTWSDLEHREWAASKADVDLDHLRVPVEWGEPLVALLADVAVPVTLVHGRRARGSIVTPSAAARCAAACRAGCEVIELDAGHCVRRDSPAPFVAVLASVLGHYER
jgi:pimeloyl-ACP methyl ester carboxylesterase